MSADASSSGTTKRERLAQRRKALGLTQEALADLLGVERSTVIRWERGERQPLPWIRTKLARALRVSADGLEELLGAGDTGAGAAERGAGRDNTTMVPRQLPAAVPDFTGRVTELQTLTRILDEAGAGAPGTVVICAIGGTAGVGKTALALHWAHQVAARFPDGQLHVNLRGFDPSGTPTTPSEAVRWFLDALGVPPERVPVDPQAQAALYRSTLVGRRMLIVLDNARDEEQVRPLLPASSACLVIVTSRNRLAGLAAADGARLVNLDVLTRAEAVQLLTARIGPGRADAEPDTIDEIACLSACLPLALAVAAARVAARPGFPVAAVADELRDAAGRLDALDNGDQAASVRAIFSWSYQQLSTESASMFRLLGLHPGPDITAPAAASLAAIPEQGARRVLRDLTRAHLIDEHIHGRYAFHDLLRAYAAAQARDHDRERERAAAIGRVLDYYLHTASHAALQLDPGSEPMPLAPPRLGAVSERPADYRQALAWFEAEHNVLLAAIALTGENGLDSHGWQLPHTMTAYLGRRGHFQEFVATQRTALAAATRLKDTTAQAVSNRHLAVALRRRGEFDQALSYALTSLGLYQQLGNRLGEAIVQQNLIGLAEAQGRRADAVVHTEQALRLYRAIAHKPGEAAMLNNLAWFHVLLGHFPQAAAFCQEALALIGEDGDGMVQGRTWDTLGCAEHHLGNLAEAAACYQRALTLSRELGDRTLEADVLTHLGDNLNAAGELPQAREAWQRAVAILDGLGHPHASQVRAKLDSIDG